MFFLATVFTTQLFYPALLSRITMQYYYAALLRHRTTAVNNR